MGRKDKSDEQKGERKIEKKGFESEKKGVKMTGENDESTELNQKEGKGKTDG